MKPGEQADERQEEEVEEERRHVATEPDLLTLSLSSFFLLVTLMSRRDLREHLTFKRPLFHETLAVPEFDPVEFYKYFFSVVTKLRRKWASRMRRRIWRKFPGM